MKQQVKLTESELKTVVKETVETLIREYMPDSIGAGVARGLEQGKLGPYNAAQKIMQRDRWDKDKLAQYQNGFERKPIQQNGTELEEYSDAEMSQGMNIYGRPSIDVDDFNEQPVNSLAAEGKQYKVNETQLHQIIRESVMRILKEKFNK